MKKICLRLENVRLRGLLGGLLGGLLRGLLRTENWRLRKMEDWRRSRKIEKIEEESTENWRLTRPGQDQTQIKIQPPMLEPRTRRNQEQKKAPGRWAKRPPRANSNTKSAGTPYAAGGGARGSKPKAVLLPWDSAEHYEQEGRAATCPCRSRAVCGVRCAVCGVPRCLRACASRGTGETHKRPSAAPQLLPLYPYILPSHSSRRLQTWTY